MDTVKEEVVVQDPETGTTQASQTTQQVASPEEVKVAKAEKKNQIVWYIIGVINALLVLRLLFLLFGAKNVGFASLLYSVTDPFVSLFKGIFAAPKFDGAYFDTAALLAIVVLSLVGWGIAALIDVMHRPAPVRE
jgi:uncharacterized protein YggT (Ycf19 family)